MIRHIYKSLDEVFEKLEPSYGHKFEEYDINHRLDEPKFFTCGAKKMTVS